MVRDTFYLQNLLHANLTLKNVMIGSSYIKQLLTQELVEDSDRLSNQQRRILTQKVIQQLLDLNDDQACLNIRILCDGCFLVHEVVIS